MGSLRLTRRRRRSPARPPSSGQGTPASARRHIFRAAFSFRSSCVLTRGFSQPDIHLRYWPKALPYLAFVWAGALETATRGPTRPRTFRPVPNRRDTPAGEPLCSAHFSAKWNDFPKAGPTCLRPSDRPPACAPPHTWRGCGCCGAPVRRHARWPVECCAGVPVWQSR